MLQLDLTIWILWWVLPIVVLVGRAFLAGYRTKKKRAELEELEEKSTPFTRKL